jgi:hypothetical protein
MNGQKIIIGVGTLLAIGFVTATSCIIPDKGINLVKHCGTRWYGIADGAKGVNQSDSLIDILVDSDWVRGRDCLWQQEDQKLAELVQQNCLQHDNEQDCTAATWCDWKEHVQQTGADVCLYDDIPAQAAWWKVVEAGITACEAAADDQNIDPYPVCSNYETQMECEQHSDFCDWNPGCQLKEFLNCKTATVLTHPETEDEDCTQLGLDECAVAGTGGGTGAGDSGGPGGGDDHGDDGSPWGDLSTQISCMWSTCEVDGGLIEAIWANSMPLIDDYDARLSFDDNGGSIHGMRITRIVSGDLPDHLGFQNSDLIYEVNGLPLTDEIDLLIAADALREAVSATVKIWRGSTTVTHWYDLAGECVELWDPCESNYDCCGGSFCNQNDECAIPL